MTEVERFYFESDEEELTEEEEIITSHILDVIEQCLFSAEHLFYASVHVDVPIAKGTLFKIENLLTSFVFYARAAGNTERNVKRLAYPHIVRYTAMEVFEESLREDHRLFRPASNVTHNKQLDFFMERARKFERPTYEEMKKAQMERTKEHVAIEEQLREIRMGRENGPLPETYAELIEYAKELDKYIKHLDIEGIYTDDEF